MKISTNLTVFSRGVSEEKAIELLAKAGFDAFDFSLLAMGELNWETRTVIPTDHPLQSREYLAFARKIRQVGLDNGIVCNQSHAPYPICVSAIWDLQRRAIECTAEAGGEICVIHPDNDKSPEENAELYLQLLPFAKSHGVKIATENMWNWDYVKNEALPAACSDPRNFVAHLEAINDPYFVACLDIGHAEMRGLNTTAPEMIHALGHHMQALHIHDNDLHDDNHAIPYTMGIDFKAVAKALRESGYAGYLTLECTDQCGDKTEETMLRNAIRLAEAARRLEREIVEG